MRRWRSSTTGRSSRADLVAEHGTGVVERTLDGPAARMLSGFDTCASGSMLRVRWNDPGRPAAARESGGGAVQVVPGITVMFGHVFMNLVGPAFLAERTWDRLRCSALTGGEIIGGKCIVPIVLATAEMTQLLAAGALLIGSRVHGSNLALAVMVAATACALTALGARSFVWVLENLHPAPLDPS